MVVLVSIDAPAAVRRLCAVMLLGLVAMLGACAQQRAATGPFPQFAQYEGQEVRQVQFAGDVRISVDSLHAITVTRPTRCRLPILPRALCIVGLDRYRLDTMELARDVARIQLYHRDHGYYGTRIVPSIDQIAPDQLAVRFAIAPGDRVFVQELEINGTEGILPPERLERAIPLRVNEPFRRAAFLASADSIRSALFREGYAYADVLRNYNIDVTADIAEVEYVAVPGPLVQVDSVLFVGLDGLTERAVRRQLTFRENDILRVEDLNRSQRNLHRLGLINFATVEIAPDTLQIDPELANATVLVRVIEGPQYLVDANVGYGTVDCLRTGARWTNRNFLGGARRLELSGSISKVGVGYPANLGLEQSICPVPGGDPFSDTINYRVAADFQQPQIFGTANRLGANVRAERLSEIDAFVRQAFGGQLSVTRDLGLHSILTTTADVEHGFTRAEPAIYCIFFDFCEPELWQPLQEYRWSNALSLAAVRDRTIAQGLTVRGYTARGSMTWSSPAIGSDDEFLRLQAEVTGAHTLRPGWALAGRLLGGIFPIGSLDPRTGFIPPERRFYAGGPNTVRGFGRNALGPVVYVAREDRWAARPEEGDTLVLGQVIPRGAEGETVRGPVLPSSSAGGTQMVVASVELRTPSPVLRDFTRLGFFVDAGQVWAREADLPDAPIRFTPGMGLRFITPVGPIRVDGAYNPYGRPAGTLYLVDPETRALIRHRESYRPETGRFLDRFQIHFAVGHAF